MTDVTSPSRCSGRHAEAAEALASVGVVLAECDTEGRSLRIRTPEGDWLATILARSRMLGLSIERLATEWAAQEAPALAELLPGCWCVPDPVTRRRRRTGYALLLMPTAGFLASEAFLAMCQGARLDAHAVATRYAGTLPASDQEVGRMARLAAMVLAEARTIDELTDTIESVGQQLSESYEEINLLYTISQRMTVVQQPRRFVVTACEGLLDTLSYRWIGVQFAEGLGGLPSLSGRLVVAGMTGGSYDQLRGLTRGLLGAVSPDEPTVLDPAGKPEHRAYAALGQPVLVHPISREGRLLGVMVAGDKHGSDLAASSADMKLLGATASHTGIFLENAALYEDMDAMFLGTLEAITASIDAKDRYTCGHSRRVAQLSQQLASAVGLDEETVRRVHVAGLVHDVGKIGVPESVLCKPGRLTDHEFDLVKQHPEIGHRILKDIPQLRDVLPGVLHHHERWDGQGYPAGLAGENIPLFARLIALADSFDAMSSTRTYRSARDRTWVLGEILRCAGRQFDPALVSAFIQMDFSEYDRLVTEHRAAEAVHSPPLEEAA